MSDAADLSGFDIRANSQDGAEMPLLDPAGRQTNVVFKVRGTDSDAYNSKMKEHLRRNVSRAPRKATEDELNAEFWELHASLVVSWTPERIKFDRDGEQLECTPKNVSSVLERHTWVFEQVRRFADRRSNFLPGPATP